MTDVENGNANGDDSQCTSTIFTASANEDHDDSVHKKRKTTINKDSFEFGQILGEGGFGQVRLVVEKSTQIQYAAKILSKERLIKAKQTRYVKSEKDILLSLDHPNVSKLYFTFTDKERLYFIMELITGGELFSVIRKLCPGEVDIEIAKFYLAQLCDALQYVHSKNIVHRDVKPENLLLAGDGHLKLVDFGISKVMDGNSLLNTFCGTMEYLAPEILRNEPYGKAVDWWAYGCVAFELLVGDSPFYATSQALIMKKIIDRDVYWPEDMSEEARDLIEKLLHPDPEKRLSGEEVRQHRFFQTIQFDQLHSMTPPLIPDVISDSEDEETISDESSGCTIAEEPQKKRNYLYAINKARRYMGQLLGVRHGGKSANESLGEDSLHGNSEHNDAKRAGQLLRVVYSKETGKHRSSRTGQLNAELFESETVERLIVEEVENRDSITSQSSGGWTSTSIGGLPLSSPSKKASLSSSLSAQGSNASASSNSEFFGSGIQLSLLRRPRRAFSGATTTALQYTDSVNVGSRAPIRHVAWMKSDITGQHILAASGNFSVSTMEYNDGCGVFENHKAFQSGSSANYISFSPCGQFLVHDLRRQIGLLRRTETIDSDGATTVRFKQSRRHGVLRGHKQPITMVSWRSFTSGTDTSRPALMAAAGEDSFVYIWNVRSKGSKLQHVFENSGHSSYISALQWQPAEQGSMLVSGGGDSQLIFYDCNVSRIVQRIDYHENAIIGLQFSPDGSVLVSHALDCDVVLLDTKTWKAIKVLVHPSPVLHCTWSPDGKYLVTVSQDVILVWSFPELQCMKTFTREGTANAQMVHFDSTSRYLAFSTTMSGATAMDSKNRGNRSSSSGSSSGGGGGNSISSTCVGGSRHKRGSVPTVVDMTTMAFCNVSSQRQQTAHDSDEMFVLDGQSQQDEFELAHRAPLTALCWSPNNNSRGGPLLATGGFDRNVSMWEIQ